VRVVIAEDQLLLRDGLSRLLRDNGLDVVAAVGDAEALLASVAEQRPEIAIVDIRMPPDFRDEGLRAGIQIRSTYPETAVLILSQYVEPAYATELLADGRGQVGYLLKDRVFDVADFIEAVHRVGEGGAALDPQVVAQLVAQHRRGSPLDRLSDREREVLGAMAEGRSNAAIAQTLVLTIGAVEKHIANIFTKLDLPPSESDNRRVLAVLAYLQQDLQA
jgi:DNA-binding NarL/FixJ family response regulator